MFDVARLGVLQGIGGSNGTFVLDVGYSALVVNIRGGSSRTSGSDLPLVLDAKSSYDPDEPAASMDSYSWRCTAVTNDPSTSGQCLGANGPLNLALAQDTPGLLSFPAGTLLTGSLYQFAVAALKAGRTASSTATVEVLAGSPPIVSIEVLSRARVATDGSVKANPNEKLVINGSASSSACASVASDLSTSSPCSGEFVWEVASGDLDILDPAVRTSRVSSPFLVLAANSLSGGGEYRFRLRVASAGATGWATLALVANLPPTGGVATASPTVGEQFNTTFVLSQTGWFDDDLPLLYGFDYRTDGNTAQLDCTSTQGWQPLIGDVAQPQYKSSSWPVGVISVRAFADDALGARACTSVALEVLPPALLASGDSAAAASFVADQLTSLTASLAQGQGGGAQVVNVLVGILFNQGGGNESAPCNSTDGACPTTGGQLKAQARQRDLTGQMINILATPPPSEASVSDKLIHAATLGTLVGSPRALTDESKATALNSIEQLSSSLVPSQGLGGVDGKVVGVLDGLLNAGIVPPDPSPPPDAPPSGRSLRVDAGPITAICGSLWGCPSTWSPPFLMSLGYDPADEEDWHYIPEDADIGFDGGGVWVEEDEWQRSRRLQSTTDSNVPPVIRTIRSLASAQTSSMVVGEAPAYSTASMFGFGVQRGMAGRGSLSATPSDESGFVLPDEVLDTLGQPETSVLRMEFDILPFRGPPRVPGKPLDTQATASLGLGLQIGAIYHPPAVLVGAQPAHAWIKRRQEPWLFSCLDTSDCSGPQNIDPPVAGQCIDGRCVCPLPWAGQKCDRLLECWWRGSEPAIEGVTINPLVSKGRRLQTTSSSTWNGPRHNASCSINYTLSDARTYGCSCGISGSHELVVVARHQNDLVAKSFFPLNTLNLPRDFQYLGVDYLKRGWIALVVIGVLNGIFSVWLLLAIVRGNESEVQRNARHYDFWREQRKNRIAVLVQSGSRWSCKAWKEWSKATINQIKGQHKVFRCFVMKYDATLQDPSAAPTAAQKVTVLYTILAIKLMVAAAVFNPLAVETYEKKTQSEKYLDMIFNGWIVSTPHRIPFLPSSHSRLIHQLPQTKLTQRSTMRLHRLLSLSCHPTLSWTVCSTCSNAFAIVTQVTASPTKYRSLPDKGYSWLLREACSVLPCSHGTSSSAR